MSTQPYAQGRDTFSAKFYGHCIPAKSQGVCPPKTVYGSERGSRENQAGFHFSLRTNAHAVPFKTYDARVRPQHMDLQMRGVGLGAFSFSRCT